MYVSIITVGDEILIGQIIDTNSAWIAEQLRLFGVKVREINTVGDDEKQILDSIESAFSHCSLILMTGGLGPTKDDITKKSLIAYFDDELVFHQPTYDRILRLFKRWGRSPTPFHREQCFMPSMAQLLKNKMGTAPGMWIENDGKALLSMPGVPYEMKSILEDEGFDVIKKFLKSDTHYLHETIRTVGEGEARIATKIEDITDALPQNMSIAFLPGLGQVRLRLSHAGTDLIKMTNEINEIKDLIVNRLGDFVYAFNNTTLEETLSQLLREKGLKLALAESCTGGFLSHMFTRVAGASDFFEGSIISYSNNVKKELLGVNDLILESNGAVSQETVIEMQKGAIRRFNADVALSVSGIAGPGGGTDEKPVGTVWIAWGSRDKVFAEKLMFGKDRSKNIELSAIAAINALRKFVMAQ